ncbi:teneurin-1 [Platysternon megacephalum]|uniref:Teneurin-1 n=1 Tax=Platysternon megacephalum TaxID=55544 RepID=A0A4D9F892_9SAUR|nr:teneurin-1 [Platysternon megacephalum]
MQREKQPDAESQAFTSYEIWSIFLSVKCRNLDLKVKLDSFLLEYNYCESEVENDELEDLVVDFTPLKRDTDRRNESRFKDMEDSDSTVEARKWIGEEQTDSIFSSTSFDNSMDRKLSETKSIRTKLTGSKRYWEKSSIAWSSYTHGELKPRSQCVQRPVSADVGKKMVYISQNIQPSGM